MTETASGQLGTGSGSIPTGWHAASGKAGRPTRVLYLYLFLFIPLFNVALDAFVFTWHGRTIPDAISLIKELVWIGVLLYYAYRFFLDRPAIRIPRLAAMAAAAFFLWQAAEWFRALPHLGHLQALLAVRNSLLYMPAMVIAAGLAQDEADWENIADYLSAIALLAGAYALLQLWGVLNSRWRILAGSAGGGPVVPAFFSDYDVFAYFAAAAFMLVVSALRPGRVSWLRVAGAVSAGVCVFVSESRGALGAWVLGIGVILLLGGWRRELVRVLAAVVIVDGLVLAVTPPLLASPRLLFGVFYRPPAPRTAIQPLPSPAPARPRVVLPPTAMSGMNQNLRDVRLRRDWPSLLHTFKQSPVVGYGLGTFGFAALSAAERSGPVADPLGVDNYYLTLGLNTGIIGVIFFLALMYAVLSHGLQALSMLADRPALRNVLIGLIAALAVFLACGIFSNLIESFPISAFFWFIVGTICAWPPESNGRPGPVQGHPGAVTRMR